ncbi:MAG TPA: hypothetical protein PK231_03005 [Acidocella sp.]|nr:hypothetical protein [Acidocella sp.]
MSITSTFTVGRDGSLVVILPTGRIDLNYTDFQAQQETKLVTSMPVQSDVVSVELPQMWKASFAIDRNSSALEDFIAATEDTFFSGGNAQLNGTTVYQYINEINGSISTYEYTNCTLKLDDAGSYKQDDKVTQKLSMTASRRKKV